MASYFWKTLTDHARVWISVLFAGVAVLLATTPTKPGVPAVGEAVALAPIRDATPVRTPVERPERKLERFTLQCNECHRSLPAPYAAGGLWDSHTNIHMAHGINHRCLNCHHTTNREAFADDDGKEIPWNQPELVCAKCHGPVFRDWQHGAHGRTNGYWDTNRGESLRLTCVQCHDPHSPHFPTLASDPGPRTLRARPHSHEGEGEERNPLRIKDNMLTNRYSRTRGEPVK